MYISEEKKEEIINKATLDNVLKAYHNFKKAGAQYISKCPVCNKEKKLNYSEAKNLVSCFSCGIKVNNAVNYLKEFHGKSFPDALKELARIELIDLPEAPPAGIPHASKKPRVISSKTTNPKTPKKRKPKGANKDQSFCDRMLEESGLNIEDVTSLIKIDDDSEIELSSYVSGSVDEKFQKVPGDDVIIRYYDLDNKPMEYYRTHSNGKKSDKKQEFFRIRYQSPEHHKDKNGKAMKYQAPWGSSSKVYLPKALRNKFSSGSKIKTLYIQEGEKKADKATKHGMVSAGILGIHNLAYDRTLPYEFDRIIRKCNVENVVFVLDEDWDNLSSKIDSKHPADSRPKSFFRAVSNFRDYFYAFTNNDIHLQIYFGHVKPNDADDKGVDDLLTNTLKGKEENLSVLCERALLEPNGNAEYLQFYKITTESEFNIRKHWGLQTQDAFIHKYGDVLRKYPEFVIGKQKWRFDENGEIELAQPLLEDEKFWFNNEKKDADGKVVKSKPTFNHNRFYKFLKNRGYGLYGNSGSEPLLIHIKDKIVAEKNPLDIRHFTLDFAETLNDEPVMNLLYAQAKNFFSKDCLSNLKYTKPMIQENSKGIQHLYFNDKFWVITKEGIEEQSMKSLPGQVWDKDITDFDATKTSPLLTDVKQISAADAAKNPKLKDCIGQWVFDIPKNMINEKGNHKCDFLQFLMNTSQFNHNNRTRLVPDYDFEEGFEYSCHVLSKLTSIGYLLHNYRDSGVLKAVVAMDGKMSEVGSSNGRSGKSLVGLFLEYMMTTVTIPGKKRDLLEDKYLWEEVDEKTRIVFMDDIMVNFNLEMLFPHITGKFTIEKKHVSKFTLPLHCSPKFYITTNHALKGDGGSFKDRQTLIAFSDWYNSDHKPKDEFGYYFFDDWDAEKRNYAYNLSALCLQLYFEHGLIEAPSGKLERRKLRQDIGEDVLEWAEGYFANACNLNSEVPKSNMWNQTDANRGSSFLGKFPKGDKFMNIRGFKNKIKKYCEYKGWEFNPGQLGKDIKRGGTEYMYIGVPDSQYNLIVNTQPYEEFFP